MVKKKQTKYVYIGIILILIITNMCLAISYYHRDIQETIQEIKYIPTKEEYNNKEKYYEKIDYKRLNKILKDNKVHTIAVVNNNSSTALKYRELINKTAYYNRIKICLIDTNSLSKKELISFYEIDERLSKQDDNYIITIKNNKILSITTFELDKINEIIKEMGD